MKLMEDGIWMWIGMCAATLVVGIGIGVVLGGRLYQKPTASVDPTANWKTYVHKNLGVIFKYPNSWAITETDTYVVALKDPDIRTVVGTCPGFSFSVSKYDPLLNYSRFDRVIKSELNGEPTVVWENNDSKCKEKVILVSDLPSSSVKPRYIISFMSGDPDGKMVFDQILSTFKMELFPITSTAPVNSISNHKTSCEQAGGGWLENYRECEGVQKSTCDTLGGKFNECDSPCRHDPSASACITLCMTVCKLP